MPERAETVFGMRVSDDDLKKPLGGVPMPADRETVRRNSQAALEAQVKEQQALGNVWALPEFQTYCQRQYGASMQALVTESDIDKIRQLQALARAWSTIIRDMSQAAQTLRLLEEKLSELRT